MRAALLAMSLTACMAVTLEVDAHAQNLVRRAIPMLDPPLTLTQAWWGISSTYYQYADYADLPDGCTHQYSDLGRKQPDRCCQTGQGVRVRELQPSYSQNGVPYNCYPVAASPDLYVRNYIGCRNGQPVMAESCTPTGLSIGNGYPMNQTFADTKFENNTISGCNCADGGSLTGMPYEGTGCFAALDFYKLQQHANLSVANITGAFFVKISGSCLPDVPTSKGTGSPNSTDSLTMDQLPKVDSSIAGVIGAMVGAGVGAAAGITAR